MSDAVSSMEASMFEKYGPLLSLPQLAEILHRTPDGLRVALHDDSSYAGQLNAAKVRIGRRMYFRTPEVARMFFACEPQR